MCVGWSYINLYRLWVLVEVAIIFQMLLRIYKYMYIYISYRFVLKTPMLYFITLILLPLLSFPASSPSLVPAMLSAPYHDTDFTFSCICSISTWLLS